MICPVCNKEATTFWRQSFTRQDVSFFKSMQGYLKCMECGALLRVIMFKKQMWIMFILTTIVLALFTYNYKTTIPIFGIDAIAAIWIVILIAYFCTFTYGIWKYSYAEKITQ